MGERASKCFGSHESESSPAEVAREQKQHAFLDLAKSGNWQKVVELIDQDCELYLNCQPAKRWTALHLAARVGNANVVRFLLQKGARRDLRNAQNQTPADVASPEVLALLNGDDQDLAEAPGSYVLGVEEGKAMTGTRRFWHGTSLYIAKLIQENGFKISADGEMGPGVYVVDDDNIDKAKRFAHDEFHRSTASVNEPCLLELSVDLKEVIAFDKARKKVDQMHFDAAYTSKTDLSKSSEWCIYRPELIRVVAVTDLRGKGCPWEGHCPYVRKTRLPGTPWGGPCPCDPTLGSHRSMGSKNGSHCSLASSVEGQQ